MGNETNHNGDVEFDTTKNTERIIRTQCVRTDAKDGTEILVHFSYLVNAVYVII